MVQVVRSRYNWRYWCRAFRLRKLSGRSGVSRPAALPRGVRIYAIGDIHGRADLLSRLHARIDDHVARSPVSYDIEVYLGDYIDRGPSSREVIESLVARGRGRRVIALAGNHESMLLDVFQQPNQLAFWIRNGGLETLTSYGLTVPTRIGAVESSRLVDALLAALPREHLRFFRSLADTFASGDYFFVHAGVRPGIPLGEQKRIDMLWIRDEFLTTNTDLGAVVVHGHTPNRTVEFRSNRINLDTGAYITGVLSCIILEGETIDLL